MTAARTATAVRRDAIRQLAVLAADPVAPTVNLGLVAGRREALEVLRRQALRRGHRAEVDRLWPLVIGDATALADACAELTS